MLRYCARTGGRLPVHSHDLGHAWAASGSRGPARWAALGTWAAATWECAAPTASGSDGSSVCSPRATGHGGGDLQSPLTTERLARIRTDLELVSGYLHGVIAEVDDLRATGRGGEEPALHIHLNTLKLATSELAFAASDRMVQLAGLTLGYQRDSLLRLERLWRPAVRGTQLHQRPTTDRQRQPVSAGPPSPPHLPTPPSDGPRAGSHMTATPGSYRKERSCSYSKSVRRTSFSGRQDHRSRSSVALGTTR
jgi:hypothetical protein